MRRRWSAGPKYAGAIVTTTTTTTKSGGVGEKSILSVKTCRSDTQQAHNHTQWCEHTRNRTRNKHICTKVHTTMPATPRRTSHTNSCDIEQLLFNLGGETQAEPQDEKKMPHLSQQYLSAGNKYRFHYTLCKRKSSPLNEMCMTPRWLPDPVDW